MKHSYFSEEEVISALGGLQNKYIQKRKTIYNLKNGDLVVIRNNSQSSDYYWYNVQRDLFHSNVQYAIFVAGYEGIYRIPMSIIANYAEAGDLSVEKGGINYKVVLNKFSEKMCLSLLGDKDPINIEQFQIYRQFYEKTNEIDAEQAASLSEGAKKAIIVNAYERNAIARKKCIEYYGTKCQVCGFDFAEIYGSDFDGLIEVHHVIPISSIQSEYTIDPIKDLIPLCSNCHTAIHKKIESRCLSIEELRKRVLSKK